MPDPPCLAEAERGRHQVFGGRPRQLRLLERQRLAVVGGQARLGIEQVDVRRPAAHEQEDHPLGPRRVVRRLRRERVWRAPRCSAALGIRPASARRSGQAEQAEAVGDRAQQPAPADARAKSRVRDVFEASIHAHRPLVHPRQSTKRNSLLRSNSLRLYLPDPGAALDSRPRRGTGRSRSAAQGSRGPSRDLIAPGRRAPEDQEVQGRDPAPGVLSASHARDGRPAACAAP